ncbi:3-hydroxybutyryl-CoA dehydrogenase [Azospirillum thermophilum]|uniref:L-gulonate 3-dehydrogenase n=1 Tax=Azospirillum thermophilum TaxID=2202148 RepID=A0A2S2CZA0_9PROT|nr:3-hydroxybutyryl-CoA dehydrogenase [Azospirillum thermophilum]
MGARESVPDGGPSPAGTGKEVIACVGAGRMGAGIAHVFAYAGHPVRLIDAKPRPEEEFRRLAAETLAGIADGLRALSEFGLLDEDDIARILPRITILPRGRVAEGLADARFVFEGVPEVLEAKREAFALIGAHAAADAVVASTTSTFLATTLAGMIARPERYLNAHWLNPAYLVPLVELSPAPATGEDAIRALEGLLEAVGKVPVRCAASPGYIVPRLQALCMNEAARMVEEGVATAEDIDRAVRVGFGFRFAVLGLLEFIDWGGGDILYYASRYLVEATGQERFASPAIVGRNMAEGNIGLKTGRGFYDFSTMDVPAYRKERLGRFLALLRHGGMARPPA